MNLTNTQLEQWIKSLQTIYQNYKFLTIDDFYSTLNSIIGPVTGDWILPEIDPPAGATPEDRLEFYFEQFEDFLDDGSSALFDNLEITQIGEELGEDGFHTAIMAWMIKQYSKLPDQSEFSLDSLLDDFTEELRLLSKPVSNNTYNLKFQLERE